MPNMAGIRKQTLCILESAFFARGNTSFLKRKTKNEIMLNAPQSK